MKPLSLIKFQQNWYKGVSLDVLLVVPFVLQIFGAVGLVGYLSFKNGEKAVNELAINLQFEVESRISQHLDSYLAIPHQIVKTDLDAYEVGILNIFDFQRTGQYFWRQLKAFNVSYINFSSTKGEYIGAGDYGKNNFQIEEVPLNKPGKSYLYKTDDRGNRIGLVSVQDYDPREEAWYSDPLKAGKPIWSEIYNWEAFPEIMSISASYPIYKPDKTPIGVIGIDLKLSDISRFLNHLKVGRSGKTFILERSGLLVASSIDEPPFIIVNDRAQRLNALNSKDPLIKETTSYLKSSFDDLSQIKNSQQLILNILGQKHYVRVSPWQDKFGLNWLIVLVVPESDFMTQINTNNRITIMLCLVALLVATLLGIVTSRSIARPIRRLSEASVAIASGDLDQTIEVKGIQELEILSNSFNQMADKLQESFSELENRVEERTAELKQAKEAAEIANKTKSQFLANMSHELRTPLNAILGFTQVMNLDSSLSEEYQEFLTLINNSGEHLLSLINDVLDMSKIEADRMTLDRQKFDLYSLLDDIKAIFTLKAESKGLDFKIELTPHIPKYINTDAQKLRQVLFNLLANAIKFTKNGSIELRVTLPNEYSDTLQFAVKDTGIGIADDDIGKLFEPFVQTETGRKVGGTGLGLVISRKFIQLMGGDINVTSELGKGTTFKFDLKI